MGIYFCVKMQIKIFSPAKPHRAPTLRYFAIYRVFLAIKYIIIPLNVDIITGSSTSTLYILHINPLSWDMIFFHFLRFLPSKGMICNTNYSTTDCYITSIYNQLCNERTGVIIGWLIAFLAIYFSIAEKKSI